MFSVFQCTELFILGDLNLDYSTYPINTKIELENND